MSRSGEEKIKKKLYKTLVSITGELLYNCCVIWKHLTNVKLIFVPIYNNRIGHLTENTEILIRGVRVGLFNEGKYIGFCNHFPMNGNKQLLKMYRRIFPILANRLTRDAIHHRLKNTEFFFSGNIGTDLFREILRMEKK